MPNFNNNNKKSVFGVILFSLFTHLVYYCHSFHSSSFSLSSLLGKWAPDHLEISQGVGRPIKSKELQNISAHLTLRERLFCNELCILNCRMQKPVLVLCSLCQFLFRKHNCWNSFSTLINASALWRNVIPNCNLSLKWPDEPR